MTDQRKGISRRQLLTTSAAAVGVAATGVGRFTAPALAADTNSIRVLAVEDPFYFAMKEVLDDFTKKTGIKVELESLSYDAMQARLVSSFVAKTSDADVVTVDQMWTGQYIDNGWIRPLDEFAKGDKEFDIKDLVPQVLYSLNTWRGHLATVPIAAYAQGVMYRKSVFEALKLDAPADDWTWKQYEDTIAKIHGQTVNGTKVNGTVVCGSQPTPIVHMFSQTSASYGARWFKSFPEGKWDFTPTMDSDLMKAAVDQYQRLYKLSPPEFDQLYLVRCGHQVQPGRHRHVLLVDALFLPDPQQRLHERQALGRGGRLWRGRDPHRTGHAAHGQPRRMELRHPLDHCQGGRGMEVPQMGELGRGPDADGQCQQVRLPVLGLPACLAL